MTEDKNELTPILGQGEMRNRLREVAPTYYGHRQRIRDRFLVNQGLGLADYELLELLLTYAIPRRDTKPMAKELLYYFRDLNGVMNADERTLMSVRGIKESGVGIIKLAKTVYEKLLILDIKEKTEPRMLRWDDMINYARGKLSKGHEEEFMIMMLNSTLNLINVEYRAHCSVEEGYKCAREISESAMFHGAVSVMVIYNHPLDDGEIKRGEYEIARDIRIALESVMINLIDYVVAGPYDYYGFKSCGDV